ncbi:MAG: methyltransferase domain-containing protein [Sphingomonas sp.]|jgi:SAM-dependent methyltransferase|nr:methyltransferase domain-containing protein [Sphingomonas sp.]
MPADRTRDTAPSRLADFKLFFDPELTQATPYDGAGDYIRLARPRLDWTFDLIAGAVPGAHIVDIGASPFYLLDRALAAGAQRASGVYFAYDQHPLRNAERIYSRHGAIELHHRDIEQQDLPFGDDTVDVLTACEILEHFDHFPQRFAQEARRVLRPGGLLLITVPNVASIGNIAKLLLGQNIYMKYRADPTGRHKHEYTSAQLRAYIDYLGMEPVAAGVMPFVTSDRRLPRLAYRAVAAAPVIRRYSPKIYMLARQPDPKPRSSLDARPPALFDAAESIEA